jgi:hypothetical protein
VSGACYDRASSWCCAASSCVRSVTICACVSSMGTTSEVSSGFLSLKLRIVLVSASFASPDDAVCVDDREREDGREPHKQREREEGREQAREEGRARAPQRESKTQRQQSEMEKQEEGTHITSRKIDPRKSIVRRCVCM